MNYDNLTLKKQELDQYRPLPHALCRNLEDWFRIELTYTSNGIEGNTLTRQETALVVEKGLTVGGKSLKEHLEAANHAAALDWMHHLISRSSSSISEDIILQIHKLILKGIDDDNAGYYRSVPVRIAGSAVILPNARKVPSLMKEFVGWIAKADLHPVQFAAEAHYELVTIHPFIDGNGRTARLLMNLILMMCGYPPAIIRKRDRLAYIKSLEQAQLGGSKEDYLILIAKAVNRSLDIYLKAVKNVGEEIPTTVFKAKNLLKIGELAQAAQESVATIRHWTKEGLLEVAEITPTGYQLYVPDMIERIKNIKELKSQRYTIKEIKNKFKERYPQP
jgi:cell filamentation protein, protein adenylyltransferase